MGHDAVQGVPIPTASMVPALPYEPLTNLPAWAMKPNVFFPAKLASRDPRSGPEPGSVRDPRLAAAPPAAGQAVARDPRQSTVRAQTALLHQDVQKHSLRRGSNITQTAKVGAPVAQMGCQGAHLHPSQVWVHVAYMS